ncbi:hypothetical protein PNA2_0938 [Pyrococcus sp. NA2]|uniref:hypothetical protein n=1 Tax=Pyrococcus sp. (strain NA2) TaxID=342949 RepID=UPI000209A911|nr:hypothetical protein [Pyrococcus sp. NA2]AEC51854.1 hypothetical protein PNA2_0938 [Pyrococcus sp. NA2]
MVSWGFKTLDREIGEIKEHSLVLIQQEDATSRGVELLYQILSSKLKQGNLIGYFNISYPFPLVMKALERFGIDPKKAIEDRRLAVIDTFGSFYGVRVNFPMVSYLEGMLSAESLSMKYAKIVQEHKETWKRLGLLEGRDIYGFAVAVSSYAKLFSGIDETLRYFELSSEIMRSHPAYKKYPVGVANFWLWIGKGPEVIFASVYRRVDYVLRTRSYFTEDGIERELVVLKTPELEEEIIKFEYEFKKDGIKLSRKL